MGRESYLLEEAVRDLTNLRFYSTKKEFYESVSRIYDNEKKAKKLNDLEKLLKKMFPNEIEFFERIMKKSPEEAKKTKEWIQEIHQFEAWKKRLARRNKKEIKKKLKPNECPRCHYDGSSKVKAGPCKGMIFEKGFVLKPGLEHQGKHCPSCGYWENIKNS